MAAKGNKRVINYTNAKEVVAKSESEGSSKALNIPKDVGTFSFKKKGKYKLNVLPYFVGKGNPYADEGMCHYERTYFVHRVGPNSESVCCPVKTFGRPKCPVCQYADRMKAMGKEYEVYSSFLPKKRQLYNVLEVVEDETPEVRVFDISHFNFGKALDAKIKDAEDDDGYANFFHLDGGMLLTVSVDEKSFAGTTFYQATNIEMKSRQKPLDDSLLDEVHCLDDLLRERSYDEIKKLFESGEDEEEGDYKEEKKEEAPKQERSKSVEKPVEEEVKPETFEGITIGGYYVYQDVDVKVVSVYKDGKRLKVVEENDPEKKHLVLPKELSTPMGSPATKEEKDDTNDEW
jgi:hypothetical protein